MSALKAKQYEKAKQELEEGTQLIAKRQKVVKLADKSEFGWETVNEYLADDLASDDEDAKRIKKAERSAARKVKQRLDLRNKKKPKILANHPYQSQINPSFFSILSYIIKSSCQLFQSPKHVLFKNQSHQ